MGFIASVGTALALWAGGVSVATGVITYGMFASFIFIEISSVAPVSDP